MSETSVTKKTYSRGIGETLQRQGIVQFPNTQTLKHASDQAAQHIKSEPAQEAVTDGECMKVAEHLVQYNDQLKEQGKTASWPEGVTLSVDGHTAFGDLLEKVAAKATGQPGGDTPTAVGAADHSNTLEQAAQVSDLGAKERNERPENYAQIRPGEGNISEEEGAQRGKEQNHPKQPNDVSGENSVTRASKSASIQQLLNKMAEGHSGQPGGDSPTAVGAADHSNDLNAAAQASDLGEKEKKERPEQYANVGQGNTNLSESANAQKGEEQDHPKQPKDAPGSNSVTRASKSAQQKIATARQAGRQSVDTLLQNLNQSFQ